MTPSPFINRLSWACLIAGFATCGLTILAFGVLTDSLSWPLPGPVEWFVVGTVVVAWVLGLHVFVVTEKSDKSARWVRRRADWGLVLASLSVGGWALVFPVCGQIHVAAMGSQNVDNFRRIGSAISRYHDQKGGLPSAAIRSADGRPLLSWRVAMLPYLGEEALFTRFRLDEAWDSANNRALLPLMPDVYRYARVSQAPRDQTFVQVLVGPGTAFERDGLKMPDDFPDGLNNTILVVESATAVPWTQPVDLAYTPDGPLPDFGAVIPGSGYRGGQADLFRVLFADGAVRRLPKRVPPIDLRPFITRNGNDMVDIGP